MTATAHFASLRSDLTVVEATAQPVFNAGRQIGMTPGRYHQFRDHRCVVTGAKSIEFMRQRARAGDSPGLWELDASDVPEVADLLAELATADVDRVREIRAQEELGPARGIIMQTCEAVLLRSGASVRRPGEKVTVTA
jgi:hypothetical protein